MDTLELFGLKIIYLESFKGLLIKFAIDFIFAFSIIKVIYYRNNRKSEFLFTFFLFNLLIFFISSMLATVELQTGFGFGLFAVFSILRYRTQEMEIKEMTFLFICTILAVINSLATRSVGLVEVMFANTVILVVTYFLEIQWFGRFQGNIVINYDTIAHINVAKKHELIEELKIRTGLQITDVEIIAINYLRDAADLRVFYEKGEAPAPKK